ncbi:MAG: ATP-binding protein, partial [Planctomycetota bacterium]
MGTLLAKEPGDRFESAEALGDLLEEAEASAWWAGRAKEIRKVEGHLPRIPVRRETRLYGREEELTTLREAWEKAVEGRGSTLFLEGETGIGKSRLADAFLEELKGRDVHALYGSYPPSGGMGGLSDAIIDHFGTTGLASSLAPYLTVTPTLVPAFAAMVKHETPPTGSEPIQGDALHAVTCHLVRALAAEKPVLWIVDDLHFAPPDSRQIVLAMARAIGEHRVLLLGTTEPGLPEDELTHFSRLENVRRLGLSRLGARQVIELLRDAFKSEDLAVKLGGRIALKSDGVPFFVFEMIRGLKEGQFIEQLPDGSWVDTKVIEDIEVPSAVRDLVEARLRDLTDEDRNLMDVAATQGFEFDPDLVARVLKLNRILVLQRLAAIERRSGVVRSGTGSSRFDHHQIQEVLCEDLIPDLRAEYHAMLAEAYAEREEVAGKDPEALPSETCVFLSGHHLEGSRPREALPFLERALTHLRDLYRNDDALALADRALATEGLLSGKDRMEVLLKRAGRLDLLGRREEQRAALDEALALADETGEPLAKARARRSLGSHLLSVSRYEEARQALQEAMGLAREAADGKEEAEAVRGLGIVFSSLGRYEEAREWCERALALSREMGDRRVEARATNSLGSVSMNLGQYEDARERYEGALALSREIGYQRGEAVATGNLGN